MDDGGGGVEPGGSAERRGSSALAEVHMRRASPAPWGFRLMGGRDYSTAITVTRVVGCSLAEHAGLKVGDVVVSINGAVIRDATHMEAQDAVRSAGDDLSLGVIRSTMDMPAPLEVDVPFLQPPLALEPSQPSAEDAEHTVDQQQVQLLLDEDKAEDLPVNQPDQQELQDEEEALIEDEEAVEEEEIEEEDEEDEEQRQDLLNKLDGIRPRLARSPGPEDIVRMQAEALDRMQSARARKDRPPTVFMLPPDRPPIRQARERRPRPSTPPFKRLVQERVRKRKWMEQHPGEDYPFEEEAARTPTPTLEEATRATMTPTPTFSDVVEIVEPSHELCEEDEIADGRISALRGNEDASLASTMSGTDLSPVPPEGEEQEVLTALSVEDTERRLEEVTAQLDALHNLPQCLRPSVQHIKEELQEVVDKLLEQLAEIRLQEEEARLAAERAEAEAAREEAELQLRAAAEAAAARAAAERAEAEALAASRPKFKTDVPEFIHEMTEKLSLERPSFPLTPLPRPIVLPGGRKWRTVADAFNEDFIAETLTSQAEVLLGKTLGNRRLSTTFPALIHERAEINESCYGCGRINFHKYSHKHDNLKNSAVYRMVHGLDNQPTTAIAGRPEKMQAADDYYQAAAKQSVAPSPTSTSCLERVTTI